MMLMGSLSLIGFPFLTGFYSKDVILELAYTKYTTGWVFVSFQFRVSSWIVIAAHRREMYLVGGAAVHGT